MLVPAEAGFDIAVTKLLDAGFTYAPWSYGSVDPRRLEGNEELQRIHRESIPEWEKLDHNSVRFQFPDPNEYSSKVVLLRSTYVGLSPPMDAASTARYHRFNHIYYPDRILLLESFIKTLLKDPKWGAWRSSLQVWAISYLYGMLMIEDSALDTSDDEHVKEWFNKHIKRWEGGLDRTTVTKRVGRVQRDIL
ncbi:hypothetical protein MMC16_001533 [Acarospora aff. strigata]|nr:hypothetical protein [Acarospora aff. strigata]